MISKRKALGLCPTCGKPLDGNTYYCQECSSRRNQYRRDSRAFFESIGICPVCGKEKLFGNEKQCISCREKAYERRKPLTEEQKQRYGRRFKTQQKELRQKRIEEGLCPRCGKRKIANGKKKCRICLDYDAEIHRKRYAKKPNVKNYRKENQLCYFCGNKIDRASGQICQSCWERCRNNGMTSGGSNEYWKNDNKIVFMKS